MDPVDESAGEPDSASEAGFGARPRHAVGAGRLDDQADAVSDAMLADLAAPAAETVLPTPAATSEPKAPPAHSAREDDPRLAASLTDRTEAILEQEFGVYVQAASAPPPVRAFEESTPASENSTES